MKTIFRITLVLTVFGAVNTVLGGMFDKDIIQMLMGTKRTVGTDFIRILIGLSAVITLIYGLKIVNQNSK